MTTQETIALAATIWDEAKNISKNHSNGWEREALEHATHCQTLYLKLCEEGTPGYQLHDVRVASAALKVVEALDVDAREIKVPGVLALALLNLRNAVKGAGSFEARVADTLAKKCDELERSNHALQDELVRMKAVR